MLEVKISCRHEFQPNGLAIAEYADGSEGIINSQGDTIIGPGKYKRINKFQSNGLAIATAPARTDAYGKYTGSIDGGVFREYITLLNTSGEEVVESGAYSSISDFQSNGMATVEFAASGNWGIIDSNLELVVGDDRGYRFIYKFYPNGLALVKRGVDDTANLYVMLVDLQSGLELFGPDREYTAISDFNSLNLALVFRNKKCGVIDAMGNIVIEPQHDKIEFAGTSIKVIDREWYDVETTFSVEELGLPNLS